MTIKMISKNRHIIRLQQIMKWHFRTKGSISSAFSCVTYSHTKVSNCSLETVLWAILLHFLSFLMPFPFFHLSTIFLCLFVALVVSFFGFVLLLQAKERKKKTNANSLVKIFFMDFYLVFPTKNKTADKLISTA